MEKYSVVIVWSAEYEMYFARIEELPGCIADGATPAEALANIEIVAKEWVETAIEEGREIPKAWTLEDSVSRAARARARIQEAMQQAVAQVERNPFGVHGRNVGSGALASGARIYQRDVRPAVAT